jgi:hypothetical protein
LDYWNKYKHLWRREKLPARTLFLREGTVCEKLYLIKRGCVRAFFYHEDRDISFQFFFEQDVLYSPESLRLGKPSLFSLETIEPCTLYSVGPEGIAVMRKDTDYHEYILDRIVELQSD